MPLGSHRLPCPLSSHCSPHNRASVVVRVFSCRFGTAALKRLLVWFRCPNFTRPVLTESFTSPAFPPFLREINKNAGQHYFFSVCHDPSHSCPTSPRIPLGPPSSDWLDTTDSQKANSCSRDSREKLTKEQRLARLARRVRGLAAAAEMRRRARGRSSCHLNPPEAQIEIPARPAGLADTRSL